MRLFSGLSLDSHSDSGPSCWYKHCSVKMDSREEDSGKLVGHRDWCFLWNFPKFFWLVVACWFMFFTRTSCHKINHVEGYCGAWPGRVLSVGVSP